MTTLTDIDRLLGLVLEADGPQTMPLGLVDAALVEARTVHQRRPFLRVLDQHAWPPLAAPLPRGATRRMATIALLALLVIAAIAAAVLVGSPRAPQVLGGGQRAFVWVGDTAHLATTDGTSAHPITPGRSITVCPTLIAGTTIIARPGFNAWNLIDVTSGRAVAAVPIAAGSERWSPDARRFAILDAVGRVGVVTFEEPAAPQTVWYDAPGIHALDWSLDGERLAIVTQIGTELAIEVLDVATGARQVAYRRQVEPSEFGDGPLRMVHWSSNGSIIALQIAVGGSMPITLVDTGSGGTARLPGVMGASGAGADLDTESALTPDGTAFAVVASSSEVAIFDNRGARLGAVRTTQRATGLAWSADGRLLAFREGDALVVVARDGSTRRTAMVGSSASFRWDAVGLGLIVATARSGGAVIERIRNDGHDADRPARLASIRRRWFAAARAQRHRSGGRGNVPATGCVGPSPARRPLTPRASWRALPTEPHTVSLPRRPPVFRAPVVTLIVAALIVVACGGSSGSPGSPSAAPPSPSPVPATPPRPRTRPFRHLSRQPARQRRTCGPARRVLDRVPDVGRQRLRRLPDARGWDRDALVAVLDPRRR